MNFAIIWNRGSRPGTHCPGLGIRRTGTVEWSQRWLPTPFRSTRTSIPNVVRSPLGPIPERSKMAGEPNAPAERMTFSAASTCPDRSPANSTPMARLPAKPSLSTMLNDLIVKFERLRILSMYATAVEKRVVSFRFIGHGPTPPFVGSLWSDKCLKPKPRHASWKAR